MENQILMEEKDSPISGSPENTESGSPTPVSGGVISAQQENISSSGGGGGGYSGGAVVALGSGGSLDGGSKKKRGRPRKYDINGNLNPAYIAASNKKKMSQIDAAVSPPPGFTLTTYFSGEFGGGPKRGRGKHSAAAAAAAAAAVNWQHHQQQHQHQHQQHQQVATPPASFGGMFTDTAGSDFTPHVITVQTGEDVAAKIHSLGQKGPGPRGVCVLAATGAISNVTIRQPGSSGGLLTYEGRFEILSLTGSYTMNEANGVTTKTGGLSISLAGPDGRVVGGNVAGWLTAANPIQVVVGTFVPFGYKAPKRKYHRESQNAAAVPVFPDITPAEIPNLQPVHLGNEGCQPEVSPMPAQSHSEADDSIGSGHNLNVVSSHNTSEWNNGSQQSSQHQQHRFYPDINVSVPGV